MSAVVVSSSSPALRDRVARAAGIAAEEVHLVPPELALADVLRREGISAGVVVLSPDTPEAQALATTEAVLAAAPATAVILARHGSLNGTLPAAMRAGVRDVVDLSQGDGELAEALRRAMTWVEGVAGSTRVPPPPAPVEKGTLIQVFSSKGGTGKSFLSCNLAAAIASTSGKDVAVVDFDLGLGDVYSYFGADRKEGGLLAIPASGTRDEVRRAGAKVLPGVYAYGVPDDPTATMSGETATAVLGALRRSFPFVLIDSPADYSDRVLAALDAADTVLMIASLDVVSLRHLSMAVGTLHKLGVERSRMRFVLNRADSKVGLDAAHVEQVLDVKVDAMIPSDRLVPTSLNGGEVAVVAHPRSDVARSVQALAARLVESHTSRRDATPARRRLFGRK